MVYLAQLGGKPWSARYLVHREAWIILDYVCEIEDRLAEPGDLRIIGLCYTQIGS